MSKIRIFQTFFLSFIFILTIPFFADAKDFNSNDLDLTPYGAGEWDYLGKEDYAFAYTKETFSNSYTSADGGNFKIEITSILYPTNTVSGVMYVNGERKSSSIASVSKNKGTMEFSGIPKGAKVFFYISVGNYDSFTFKFYD